MLRQDDLHEFRESGRVASEDGARCKDAPVPPANCESLQATEINAKRMRVLAENSHRCRSSAVSREECTSAKTTMFEDLAGSRTRAVDGDRTLNSSALGVPDGSLKAGDALALDFRFQAG